MLQAGGYYRIDNKTHIEVKTYVFETERTYDRAFALNRNFEGVEEEKSRGVNLTVKSENLLHTDLHVAKQWSNITSLFVDIRNLFNRENFLPSVQINPSRGG